MYSPNGQPSLTDLVREHLQTESSRVAAARSRGLLTHSTLVRLSNGSTKSITHKTAQGLAIVLRITVEDVYAAYGAERLCPGCADLVRRLLKL